MKSWGWGKIGCAVLISFCMVAFFSPDVRGASLFGGKIKYVGDNYVFSGKWTQKEISRIVELQDKAKNLLEQCVGFISPVEQQSILNAYNRSMVVHIKNNRLGRNIGASVARRSIEDAKHLAMDLDTYVTYSAMQINVRELFPRGEIEILKTLLHEMAHNASPNYSHPRMSDIWNLDNRRLRAGRAMSEYYETVPLRVENCVRKGLSPIRNTENPEPDPALIGY